ncbi:MAG: penicillin-insensitive murein endopeptidase [Bdellovibrionales bacterium]
MAPKVEINDDGETVVELLPIAPAPTEDPVVQRLEEEIRQARAARSEAKLEELEDEKISFSNPKVTFKHDGTKEVSLDVTYQDNIESIVFVSPEGHGKHFMFLKSSGFSKRNVTLQGMCLDDENICNELVLQVAYYVDSLKVTEQFTVSKPAPVVEVEEIEEEIEEVDEIDSALDEEPLDKAPEIEFTEPVLETPSEETSLDVTTPQIDQHIHFTDDPKLEVPPADTPPNIDTTPPPAPAAPISRKEPSTTPPSVMSEAPQALTPPTDEDRSLNVPAPFLDPPVLRQAPPTLSLPPLDSLPAVGDTPPGKTQTVDPGSPSLEVMTKAPVIGDSPTEGDEISLTVPALDSAPETRSPPTLDVDNIPSDAPPDTPTDAPTKEATEDLVFTAADEPDTGSALAPKNSPRPQPRPDNLGAVEGDEDVAIDGDSINVGAGRFVLPNIDGSTATDGFDVASAEDYSLSLDATSNDALLTEIQTTEFHQSERFYSRYGGRSGKIVNATQLDSRIPGAKMHPGRRNNHYASGLLTKTLQYVFEEFHRRHPDVPACVKDLSKERGGQLSRHSSHQNGLDADISFPSATSKCDGNYFINWKILDGPDDTFRQKNWEFLNILINTERVNTIFIDSELVHALCTHAKKPSTGSTKAQRNKIFNKLRHEPGHANHYHVRMVCNSQNVGCITQPLPGNITRCD